MIGLMTLWFGGFAGQPAGGGYFHLCPACHRECIEPHLEELRERMAELHPGMRRGVPEPAERAVIVRGLAAVAEGVDEAVAGPAVEPAPAAEGVPGAEGVVADAVPVVEPGAAAAGGGGEA